METSDIQASTQRALFFHFAVFNDSMHGDNNLYPPRFNEKALGREFIQGLSVALLALVWSEDYFTSSKSTSVTSGSPASACAPPVSPSGAPPCSPLSAYIS